MLTQILPTTSLEVFSPSVEMGYNELLIYVGKSLPNIPQSLSELIVGAHFSHSLEKQKQLLSCVFHSFVLRFLSREFDLPSHPLRHKMHSGELSNHPTTPDSTDFCPNYLNL